MISPFLALVELGHTLVDAGIAIFAVVWVGVQGLGFGLGALAVSSAALAMATPLLVSGLVLAYVVPLLPVIAWAALVLAFVMTAIEAIAAAPLAIVMLCVPEGSGMAGQRLQTAIQLLTSAIVMPSLLVLGLLAAIVLSYLGFSVANALFWPVVETFNYSLVGMLVSLVVYVSLIFQICQWCVRVIHRLPTQILEWFAAGGRRFGAMDLEIDAAGAARRGIKPLVGAASPAKQVEGLLETRRPK